MREFGDLAEIFAARYFFLLSSYSSQYEASREIKMMWRAIAIIIILAGAFGQEIESNDCSDEFPCVRFCCENCTDYFLGDEPGVEKLEYNYSVLLGKPCASMYKLTPEEYDDDVWSFESVKPN